MRKRYTHLFFDLDNTLWHFEKNSFDAMKVAFEVFELKKNGIDFINFFSEYSKNNDKLWQDYRNRQVTKKELTNLRFQLTFDALKIKEIDPDEMNEFYFKEMPKHSSLVSGAKEILEYLIRRGYCLCIITNGFRMVQYKKMEKAGILKYFAKVFVSEEVKVPKPSKEIFDYAVKSVNAKKINSIMVGDDPEVDIEGAINYGIDAIWYNPGNVSPYNGSFFDKPMKNVVFPVHSLKEISTIL